MEKIVSFKDQHAFLSNMACSFTRQPELHIRIRGMVCPSTEHAYQMAKTLDMSVWKQMLAEPSPYKVKKMGRSPEKGGLIVLRDDWDEIKLKVMEGALKQKFAHPEYRTLLLSTGKALLIEGNTWGDTYWGMSGGKGENHLGRLLMEIRAQLKQ